jgi:hypothetical protein
MQPQDFAGCSWAISQDNTGRYMLDGVPFEDLNELIDFAGRHAIPLAENEYTVGRSLGSMVLALSETDLDKTLVLEALDASTDIAYVAGARALENILREWREENEREV